MSDLPVWIAVCDDDRKDLEKLSAMVKQILEKEKRPVHLDSYASSQELFRLLHEKPDRYQILVLDVLMDEIDGISMASRLRSLGTSSLVIFVSTNREMALLGYEVEAVRYLAKPVEEKKLREALGYCIEKLQQKKILMVKMKDGCMRKIRMDRLAYIEICGRNTILIEEGHKWESLSSIRELEEELPAETFCRCHQSFLVNLDRVESIQRYELTLQGGLRVPVSKSKYNETRERLFFYVSD